MNLMTGIAFYAVICKELGEPFVYPGNDFSWNAEYDHSSVGNDADFQVSKPPPPVVPRPEEGLPPTHP
jgi:hypothetical protein